MGAPKDGAASGGPDHVERHIVIGHFDPRVPYAAAEQIVAAKFSDQGVPVLRYWRGEHWRWEEGAYRQYPTADLRAMVWRLCCAFMGAPAKRRHVDDIIDAMRAVTNLNDGTEPPTWIDTVPYRILPDPSDVIVFRNGVLQVSTRRLYPPSPSFFTLTALPFDWEETPPPPSTWFKFLFDVFGPDGEKKNLLCEFMGSLLVSQAAFEKILFILGPRRSGKGVIAQVIAGLVGQGNVAWPGLSSLGAPFGMACLIGKSVAIISDARLSRHTDLAVIAENLLRISANDPMSVGRKHREDYTGKLGVRLVMAANEMPYFADASSALPGRFLVLQLTRSFYGQEDTTLKQRLTAELPGILHWALGGLQTLTERGAFDPPASSTQLREELEQLASPVGQFVAECCVTHDPAAEVACHLLYARWREWCEDNGRDRVGTAQVFGRDLRAALPTLEVTQPRADDGARVRTYVGIRLRGQDEPG